MVTGVAAGLGFVAMVVMGASILGTVERRERVTFVVGIALVLVGLTFVSGSAGGLVALVGFIVVAASTVPMLLESPEA